MNPPALIKVPVDSVKPPSLQQSCLCQQDRTSALQAHAALLASGCQAGSDSSPADTLVPSETTEWLALPTLCCVCFPLTLLCAQSPACRFNCNSICIRGGSRKTTTRERVFGACYTNEKVAAFAGAKSLTLGGLAQRRVHFGHLFPVPTPHHSPSLPFHTQSVLTDPRTICLPQGPLATCHIGQTCSATPVYLHPIS